MKVRFYSIKDLYNEVKGLPTRFPHVKRVVRAQFLERTYPQEYRGGGQKSYLLTTEQTLTLSLLKPPLPGVDKDTVYYYSQPYFRCSKYELKDKATAIDEKQKGLESQVRETFKGWTVKKGVYEVGNSS